MFTSFLKFGFILSCFLSYSFEKEFARNFCSKKSIPPGKILVKVWHKTMGLICQRLRLMLWTWAQKRGRNISKIIVFVFHHSTQYQASGYTFYDFVKWVWNLPVKRPKLSKLTSLFLTLNTFMKTFLRFSFYKPLNFSSQPRVGKRKFYN